MENLKIVEPGACDPSRRVTKRLREANFASDASEMEWTAGQGFLCKQITFSKEQDAISGHCLFPSDVEMLSFSSLEDVGEARGTISELLSQDIQTLRQYDGQSNAYSQSRSHKINFHGGREPLHNKSQHAVCQNEERISINDELGTSQIYAKSAFHFDYKQSYNVGDQRDYENPIGVLQQSTSSCSITTINYSVSPQLQDVIDKDMTLMPKKHKSAPSDLSPWHKEVTEGARPFQSMSTTELDWAQAVNRLVEKIDVECESKHNPPTARSWRRLILTTQLMQQLFPPLPATFLTANATNSHGSITYIVSKLALIDACSLIYCPEDRHIQHLTGGNMISKELNSCEKDEVCSFSDIAENCRKRFRKLENDFLRWEKGYSTIDLRMECHELEKYTTIIRFARFHEQAQTEEVENSIQAANCEVFPQRYPPADSSYVLHHSETFEVKRDYRTHRHGTQTECKYDDETPWHYNDGWYGNMTNSGYISECPSDWLRTESGTWVDDKVYPTTA